MPNSYSRSPVMALSRVVQKGHSKYVNVPPAILTELRWKKGDSLVVICIDGDVMLRKLRADEIADAMRGAIYRRRDLLRGGSSTDAKKA